GGAELRPLLPAHGMRRPAPAAGVGSVVAGDGGDVRDRSGRAEPGDAGGGGSFLGGGISLTAARKKVAGNAQCAAASIISAKLRRSPDFARGVSHRKHGFSIASGCRRNARASST